MCYVFDSLVLNKLVSPGDKEPQGSAGPRQESSALAALAGSARGTLVTAVATAIVRGWLRIAGRASGGRQWRWMSRRSRREPAMRVHGALRGELLNHPPSPLLSKTGRGSASVPPRAMRRDQCVRLPHAAPGPRPRGRCTSPFHKVRT
jgi:hypothetical protein